MESFDWGGTSALDPKFLNVVKDWIDQDGEVYAMYWFVKTGGAKAHHLFNSYDQFFETLTSLSLGRLYCTVDVYRRPQFPVRGWVNEDFIKRTLLEIPDKQDWFLVGFDNDIGQGQVIGAFGDNNPKTLIEELNNYRGKYVIIGPDIHWPVSPNDYPGEWISAEVDNRKTDPPQRA
jgi:hypothetical protein